MTIVWTTLSLLAFAANSILCRLALGQALIDAASFTTIRLASGALLLAAITWGSPSRSFNTDRPGWRSAFVLFAYAIGFSYAYASLTTGAGALLLFGAVQTTMIAVALLSGERPRPREWIGFAMALGGIVYLLSRGLAAPPLGGSLLMIVAGIAWGFYSLWGRQSKAPVEATTHNFIRSVPFTIVVSLFVFFATSGTYVTTSGVVIAIVSGAVTSGLGYVAWYAVLPRLTATRAALLHLPVPVLSAAGGVVVMNEVVTLRLVVAALLVLGGITLSISGRKR